MERHSRDRADAGSLTGKSIAFRYGFSCVVMLTLMASILVPAVGAQVDPGPPPIYVISITGTIDLGLAPYLERILNEAEEAGAAAVIVEIDTPGGRVDAVLQMKDALLDANVPTIAFVNRTAFSAGALIAIASEQIYMVPGAVMGAATPVDGAGETASEKVISAIRKTFKSTAEVRGRNPIVAEAMVDPDVVIDGLVGSSDLLTLTTTEAVEWGYTDGVVADRMELIQVLGLEGLEIVETSPGPAERLVRFITDPVVASLMITAAILLIIGDLFVGGVGAIGLFGMLLLGLFFWGHNLAGLAGWEDIALVALGLVLIGIEIFVIPGFGVPGILGLALLAGGFWLAMVGRDIRSPESSERAGWSVAVAMIAILVGSVGLLSFMPKVHRLGGLVLQGEGVSGRTPGIKPPRGWLGWFGGGAKLVLPSDHVRKVDQTALSDSLAGATGIALTDLRPSGTATINEQSIDVVTRGEYLLAGDMVIVLLDEGYRRVVRRYLPGLEEDQG